MVLGVIVGSTRVCSAIGATSSVGMFFGRRESERRARVGTRGVGYREKRVEYVEHEVVSMAVGGCLPLGTLD